MRIDPAAVLASYPRLGAPRAIRDLGGAGGFSGARLWRITTPDGDWCLRRWPLEHPPPDRLAEIHKILVHVASKGIDFVPVPLSCDTGQSFVARRGHLWEVVPWMPGEALLDRDRTTTSLVRSAMIALARFHVAAAAYQSGRGPAPGLASRLEELVALKQGGLAEIRRHGTRSSAGDLGPLAHDLAARIERWIDPLAAQLRPVIALLVPLQPCIRDIWCDHVLFVGDRVTGLIDFGAMRTECVSADVARLAGSLVEDDPSARHIAIDAYQSVRPLSNRELQLVPIYDRVGVILAVANWLRWLLVEQREFDDPRRVIERLELLARRLMKGEG